VLFEAGHENVVCVAEAELEVLEVERLDDVGAKVAFGMIAPQASDLGTADPSAYLR
jgi:hypothetical protein